MLENQKVVSGIRHVHLRCDGCEEQKTLHIRQGKPLLHAVREAKWYMEGEHHFCENCVSHIKE